MWHVLPYLVSHKFVCPEVGSACYRSDPKCAYLEESTTAFEAREGSLSKLVVVLAIREATSISDASRTYDEKPTKKNIVDDNK